MKDISELYNNWPKYKPIPKLSKDEIRVLKQNLPNAPDSYIKHADEKILDNLIKRGFINERIVWDGYHKEIYFCTTKIGMVLIKLNEISL